MNDEIELKSDGPGNGKKITNEMLAIMIARGFEGVDKRFGVVDGRFRGIDGRLDGIDGRLDGIDVRLDHLDASVAQIQRDVHELKEGVVYQQEYEDSLGRIKYVERKLGIESGK